MKKKGKHSSEPRNKWAEIELWTLFLVLAVPTTLLIINVNDSTFLKGPALYILATLLVIMWIFRKGNEAQSVIPCPTPHLWFLLYILASAISLSQGISLHSGIEALTFLASCGVVFWLSYQIIDTPQRERMTSNAFVCLIAAVCLIGLAQVLLPIDASWLFITRDHAAISTFGNTTYFAGFLSGGTLLLLGLAMSGKGVGRRRLLMALIGIASVYLLIKTGSRSAWIATLSSTIVFALFAVRDWRKRILVLTALSAICVVLFFGFGEVFSSRLSTLFEMGAHSSFARRLYFYGAAWSSFLSSPIVGNGIGNFGYFLPKFRSPDYWTVKSEDIAAHAHDEYLEILSETGILGFICFCAIVVIGLRSVLQRIRNQEDAGERTYLAGLVCAVLAGLIDNLGSMNLRTVPNAIFFWTVFGMMLRRCSDAPPGIVLRSSPRMKIVAWILGAVFVAALMWYIPHLIDRYRAEKYFLEGNLLRWSNESTRATPKFELALQHDPRLHEARLYVAANKIETNNYTGARREIQLLLDQHPYFPKARIISAIAAFELGDTTEALNEIQKELTITSSPQTMYYASMLLIRSGDRDRGLQLVNQRLKASIASKIPDFAALGVDQLNELNPQGVAAQESRKVIEQLLEIFPHDPEILLSAAEFYAEHSLYLKAQETLSRIQPSMINNVEGRERIRVLSERLSKHGS